MTVSHSALLAALHSHPFDATVRLNDAEVPAAGTLAEDGDNEKLHVPAACVTVNTLPATVMVPARSTVNWLAETVNPTVPFPVPGVPNEIDIQFELLVAVRWQFGAPLTRVM